MPHTFVEVTKNEVPVQTLYFLVPVGRKEAVEEMRRRIAERGILAGAARRPFLAFHRSSGSKRGWPSSRRS
jgi:hypothetical protein